MKRFINRKSDSRCIKSEKKSLEDTIASTYTVRVNSICSICRPSISKFLDSESIFDILTGNALDPRCVIVDKTVIKCQ